MSNYSIKHLPKSQIEVQLEIQAEDIAKSYQKSLARFIESTEVKGFRKGKAPANMVEAVVGREKIYEDAINRVIPEQLEESLKQEAAKDTTQRFILLAFPQFSLENEWKDGQPLKVKAICTLYPKVDVSKVEKELKVSHEAVAEVSDKDVEESIQKIFEQYKLIKAQDNKEKAPGLVDTQGNTLISNEEELKIDDAFAKAAGAQDLADLHKMVKDELQYERQTQSERDFEDKIIRQALALVDIDIPEILVTEELNRIEQRFRAQLDRLGINFESYLSNEGKTEEQVRTEWRTKAEENTKVALILNEWRIHNNILLSQEEIDRVLPQNNGRQVSQQEYESIVYMLGQTKSLQHLKDHVQK